MKRLSFAFRVLPGGICALILSPAWAQSPATTQGTPPAPRPVTSTQPVLPAPSGGVRRGLEIPDPHKNNTPDPKAVNPADSTKHPLDPSAQGSGTKQGSGPAPGTAGTVRKSGDGVTEQNALQDPFDIASSLSGEARCNSIFRELLRVRDARDPILRRATEVLLQEGEIALPGIQAALKSSSAPALIVAAKCLEQLNPPAAATWLMDALRRGVQADSTKALFDALCVVDSELIDHLFELVDHRNAALRSRAAAVLIGKIRPVDEPRVQQLATSRRAETRQLAAQLSANLNTPQSVKTLLGLLADPVSSVSFAAAETLARCNAAELPTILATATSNAAIDRTFAYLCITLAMREEQRGELFPVELTPQCLEGLKSTDPFIATASAVAMASLGYRMPNVSQSAWLEGRVMPILVTAAAGERYFPDFNAVHSLALRQLSLLTDRNFGPNGPAWAHWWAEQKTNFRANRAVFDLPESEVHALTLDVESAAGKFTLRGDNTDPGNNAVDDEDYILTTAEMNQLATRIRDAKFMETATLPGIRGQFKSKTAPGSSASVSAADPITGVQRLILRHNGQRKELGVASNSQWPELQSVLDACAAARTENLWQRYCNTNAQPDRAAFVAAERDFLSRESNPDARFGRLMVHILEALPNYSNARRASAYQDLLSIPGLAGRLSEERAIQLAADLKKEEGGSAVARDLIKIVSLIPNYKTFDALIESVATLPRSSARAHLPHILEQYPLELSVRALDDPRALVRAAAVENVGRKGSAAAVAILLDRLQDTSEEVQVATINALASRGEAAAIGPIKTLAATATGPVFKEVVDALGRLNATDSFEILWKAIESPDLATRVTGLTAVGRLGDSRGADFLCLHWLKLLATSNSAVEERVAARNALLSIRSESTRDALRRSLEVTDLDVRREIVLALAEIGDPVAVPALLSQLERAVDGQVRNALVTLTCVDFFDTGEALLRYRDWWEANRSLSPTTWFTIACTKAGLATELSPAVLESKNAQTAIPALNEVLVSARDWYLRIRAAELLNSIAGKRLATVDRFTNAEDRRKFAEAFRKIYEKKN